MLQFKRHHKLLLVLVFLFAVAWAVWTLILLPKSENPSLPDPGATSAPPAGKTP